jgi:hypothetical protein
MDQRAFASLTDYLSLVPGITGTIGSGATAEGMWWVKFSIDIHHPLAWHVVQEIGHVVNYLSLNERLPATFYPVSAPPYLNGGPAEFLAWIIETKDREFRPGTLQKWLEGRLPQPVNDLAAWPEEDED